MILWLQYTDFLPPPIHYVFFSILPFLFIPNFLYNSLLFLFSFLPFLQFYLVHHYFFSYLLYVHCSRTFFCSLCSLYSHCSLYWIINSIYTLPNYFTFLASLSISRFISYSLPIPLIIFFPFLYSPLPIFRFFNPFFYALCLSILYSLPNFIAFTQCFIQSCMPGPLAPDPIRVQSCVWCLFWTNGNCMAVTPIFLSSSLSNKR